MIIVGELINASRKSIRPMIEDGDEAAIVKLAREQVEAGADYVDVNAGIYVEKEPEYLRWLVKTVQSEVDVPCCIDSPSPKAVEAALEVHKGTPMVNSISLEEERIGGLLPLVAGTDMKVIALCVSDTGMPKNKQDRMETADKLVAKLQENDIPRENIYLDPLVQPVATNNQDGMEFLNTIEEVRAKYPEAHTMCGLSNISFGLPLRKFANRTFMVMAITKGLDGAIVNPKDKRMMASILAAESLSGRDYFCENYLTAYREGRFEF